MFGKKSNQAGRQLVVFCLGFIIPDTIGELKPEILDLVIL